MGKDQDDRSAIPGDRSFSVVEYVMHFTIEGLEEGTPQPSSIEMVEVGAVLVLV